MKIHEIVINHKKQVIDKLVNTELSNNTMEIYNIIIKETNEFTILSYERYSPDYIASTLDDLYELAKLTKCFYHVSQLPVIIQILIDYFENS